MRADSNKRAETAEPVCADRIGFAKLTTMAFHGIDLRPLREELMSKIIDGTAGAGEGLDLSLIAQLLGDKQIGLSIQAEVVGFHQLFRSPCAMKQPKLRVLALAAAIDMGGNTPIEFLLEESGIELLTLYVVPGIDLPLPLPDHDVAIVIASDSRECRDALRVIDEMSPRWPRPLLNPPRLVCNLDRDKLHGLLRGVEGLEIPATIHATRVQLAGVAQSEVALAKIAAELRFPIIARPHGSHAGVGLAKLDDPAAIDRYLAERPEQEFFLSRFVDYAGEDGLFRKYRIVFVAGQALRVSHGDRRAVGYLVPQCRNVGQCSEASRRRNVHAHFRDRIRAPSCDRARRHGGTNWSRLLHRRLRRKQARRIVDIRG